MMHQNELITVIKTHEFLEGRRDFEMQTMHFKMVQKSIFLPD